MPHGAARLPAGAGLLGHGHGPAAPGKVKEARKKSGAVPPGPHLEARVLQRGARPRQPSRSRGRP
eukprot:9161163-Pyramimonas_sp.AAC.1